MTQRVVIMLLGIWLMVSPNIIHVNDVIADNDHIVGPLIVAFSVIAMSECTNRVILMNVPFGIWLLTAPWILGYENSSGTINDSAVGCLIIIIAVSGKWNQRHQYGGGWSSLFR